MADLKPIYKRVNGEWVKQTAFQRTNGEWVKISEANEQTYTVSGVWVFYDDVYLDWGGVQEREATVNFTSNGTNFTKMKAKMHDALYYEDSLIFNPAKDVWTNNAYKTVDFGSTPQEVSQDFYEWFRSNAIKQEEPTGNATIYFNILYEGSSKNNSERFTFMQESFSAAQGESCKFNNIKITSDTLSINESGNLELCNGKANSCYFSYDTNGTIYLNSGETFTINYTIEKMSGLDRVGVDIIKVVLNPKIITFSVKVNSTGGGISSGTYTYHAYEGMTWGEWVNSSFNTDGYYVDTYDNSIGIFNSGDGTVENITSSSVIKANTTYTANFSNDVV